CQVYVLEHLSEVDLIGLIQKALHEDEYLQQQAIVVEEYEALLRLSGGDARKLLNVLELVVNAAVLHKEPITNAFVLKQVQQNMAIYDKAGEQHYD
ncbi:hypothetical protein, partial [Enterobacter hormaechei]